MGVEAKGVLDVALADSPPTAEDPTTLVLRAVANAEIGRYDAALKDLAHPFIGNQHDAPLWRALIHARQGKWNEAREGFRTVGMTLGTLPLEVQRTMLKDSVRASVETGDITGAVTQMQEFEAIGIPRELEPTIAVLQGRIAEGLGRIEDALRSYQAAVDSWDRPAASQATLRELVLRRKIGQIKRPEAISQLETLTTVWRGDETEVEALAILARLYTEEGRFRDAFHIMRTALAAHSNSEMAQRIRDEAAETFENIFLAGKGDGMLPIDALSLFYDFRDLTPIGRRGDEMIRRLADRLVSVDLLDQAAELLQHQVDHRLQGAARSQVGSASPSST
jgi:tetratricopeptide (TPR) repeat protein